MNKTVVKGRDQNVGVQGKVGISLGGRAPQSGAALKVAPEAWGAS